MNRFLFSFIRFRQVIHSRIEVLRQNEHLRVLLAYGLLGVTLFVMGWGINKFGEIFPEFKVLAAILSIVAGMVFAVATLLHRALIVNALVKPVMTWVTASWCRLGAIAALSAFLCLLAWWLIFAAVETIDLTGSERASDQHCRLALDSVLWKAQVTVQCSDKLRRIWAPRPICELTKHWGRREASLWRDKVGPIPCKREELGDRLICTRPVAPVLAQAKVRLLIYFQLSKGEPYEIVIRNAFRESLESRLKDRYDIVFEEGQGTKQSYWNLQDVWKGKVANIVARYPSTAYVVTVGSDASSAMLDYDIDESLSESKNSQYRGILLLGVTDPIRAGYAQSDAASGIPRRAVVRYGTGADDWAYNVLRVFDENSLPYKPEFIYDETQLQDSWVAEDLIKSPLNRARIVVNGPLPGNLTVDDLAPGKVYFAWYALDTLITEHFVKLDDYLIVPSTYSEANVQRFGVVVSIKDEEVGETGAEFLATAILGDKRLEELPTRGPPFHIWLNCTAVERKKIPLSPGLRAEHVIFVPDAGETVPRTDCLPREPLIIH